MRRREFLAGAAAAGVSGAVAHASPEPAGEDAETALRGELARAAVLQRSVLLVFHASWCSWCRLLDAFLTAPEVAPLMERHFSIVHMRVQEHQEAMRARQLAGADALYARYAAKAEAGLPFFLVLDAQGRARATSLTKKGENIGFPVTPGEIAHFDAMLRTGAPTLTADEFAVLHTVMTRIAPRA
jgi:thiol:disulfide interchange protein